MNLIQQLQQTSKWKKFEEWYLKQSYPIYIYNKPGNKFNQYEEEIGFVEYPIEFTKSVFEKFIESQGFNVEKQLWDISVQERSELSEKEILSKRYTEAWFIRTSFLVDNHYATHCINPIDNYLQKHIPFNSFEELLIWYFNN